MNSYTIMYFTPN